MSMLSWGWRNAGRNISAMIITAAAQALLDELRDFFQETLRKAKQIAQTVIYASHAFIQKVGSKMKFLVQHCYRKNGQEFVYEGSKFIDAETVPADIRAKAERQELVEITGMLTV